MKARRSNHIAAVSADVDASAQHASSIVTNRLARMREVEVYSAASGCDGLTLREVAVHPNQLLERGHPAVVGVDVDDYKSTGRARSKADV
jgi:hypothetical protein